MRRLIFPFLSFVAAVLFVSSASALPCAADTFAFVPKGDGTIARFRVDARTGELVPLPGATDTGIERPVTLLLSVDKKFLYAYPTFDQERDGEPLGFGPITAQSIKAAHDKPTPLRVYLIQSDGDLRPLKTINAPGPIGQLILHPGGRFVYALTFDGAFLFAVNGQQKKEGAGALRYLRRLPMQSSMTVVYSPVDRNGWQLAFSPSGNYLYDHYYIGWSSEGSGYLQRYRVDRVTGALRKDGEAGEKETIGGYAYTSGSPADNEPLWEGVWCFVNRTAFLTNWDTFRVCRIDANERILAKGSRFSLMPNKRSNYGHDPFLLSHPKLPVVIFGGSAADSYTIWRVSSPGHVFTLGSDNERF